MNERAVEACTLEDVVNVGSATANFASQPSRGSFLATKFLPNKITYMNHSSLTARLPSKMVSNLHISPLCVLFVKKIAQG